MNTSPKFVKMIAELVNEIERPREDKKKYILNINWYVYLNQAIKDDLPDRDIEYALRAFIEIALKNGVDIMFTTAKSSHISIGRS